MRQLGLTVYKPEKAYRGYTLFAPQAGTDVYLIDMRGSVVHRWRMPYRPASYGYLLDDGHLLFGGATGRSPVPIGGTGGIVLEADWDGNILWEYREDTLHHDFRRAANGNTVVLGYEPVPPGIAKLVAGGAPDPEADHGMWSDYFREVAPDGKMVWEWHAHEYLDTETDVICPLEARSEWTHANALGVMPDGNLLTSFRLLDTVAIVDRTSGRFLWKWGRGELGHQHDPSPLDNGNILIFDNGWHSPRVRGPRSRVVEVDPSANEIVWTYETRPGWNFFSFFISGAQRLPNGNTLICEGMTGRLFEVTYEGEIVWEYVSPFYGEHERFGRSNTVFRAYRYGPDFPGFSEKDLDPGRYAWLNHLTGA